MRLRRPFGDANHSLTNLPRALQIWDLRAGKLMTEFDDHSGPVNDVEFHPHEFLLASASNDRYVNFYDLEQFKLVSTSERDSGPVR